MGKNFSQGQKIFGRGENFSLWRFEWEKNFPGSKNFSPREKKLTMDLLNGKKIFRA
jgi:hypothetical protein